MTKILVVDDDPGLVRALGINLRARHFEVEGIERGHRAVAARESAGVHGRSGAHPQRRA